MSIIPLLICCYLITVRFFSIEILVGIDGLYFLLAVIFALLGLFIGRRLIQEIVERLLQANEKERQLVAQLAKLNQQLEVELGQRKRSEENQTKSNLELAEKERRLEAVIADLKKSHGDLKTTQLQLIQVEKLESVGRLAAGVAHEVKNPLAIILMGVNYLSAHLGSRDERTSQTLQDIDDAVRRADTVIKGLLDFSSSKTLELNLTDFNPIVEKACLLVKHELDKSRIALVKELKADLPLLRLDANKIEQLLVNVFMNAVQAMPTGGTLTVRTLTRPLTQRGRGVGTREGDRFRVGETAVITEVEDTGTGIPHEHLGKLFDPFFTTKAPGQGTGLGLTVVQNIIDLHGGTIDITNRDGGGAKVTIMLKVRMPTTT